MGSIIKSTSKGENAKVTIAFAPKFTSTAMLSPCPRRRRGKISEIISQPIGPKDNCKITLISFTDARYNTKM